MRTTSRSVTIGSACLPHPQEAYNEYLSQQDLSGFCVAPQGVLVVSCDVIVGASSGLGAALATHLMSHGRDVVIAARRLGRLNDLTCEHRARSSSRAVCVQVDLRVPAQVLALARSIQKEERVDRLFLVAGANEPHVSEDLTARQSEVDSYLRLMFAGWIPLVEWLETNRVLTEHSSVVGISSIAGGVPFKALPIYGAAKAGLEHWLRSTRQKGRSRRVVVRPGRFNSEFFGTGKQPIELPLALAERICTKVDHGRNEIYFGSFRDRISSVIHRGAQALSESIVKDASPDRKDT